MGTRALQFLMALLLAGCVGWASAIFFGPWALTKYLENQVGAAVKVSGLKVTPKLAVTASRIQMSDGGAVAGSLRGVQVDWNLFLGDGPAVLISVASAGFAGSLAIEDVQVAVTQSESGAPLKISGTAARAGGADLVSAADVKFDADTDYNFQLLRRVTATTGNLKIQRPANITASTSQMEIDQYDLGANLMWQDLSGTLALTDLAAGRPDLTSPEARITFALSNGLAGLSLRARELRSEASGVAVSGLTGGMDYDAARAQPAGPIDLALRDFVWRDIQLPAAEATITLGDGHIKVSAEGTSLGSEITVGRRYIGRAPDASFVAALELLGAGGEARIIGDLNVAAASEPVVLGVSVSGAVANARRLPECANLACGVSDVAYDYRLSVGGETLSGTSRCQEPTCSVGGRRHEVATSDTNKFFANLQGVNLLNPIVLGGAYAQMLQGAAVGAGHKINF